LGGLIVHFPSHQQSAVAGATNAPEAHDYATTHTTCIPSDEPESHVRLPSVPQDSLFEKIISGSMTGTAGCQHPPRRKRQPATRLTHQQKVAIEMLVIGRADVAVAQALRIHPKTVGKWRRNNKLFKCELERRRAEVWGKMTSQVQTAIFKAIDVFEKCYGHVDPTVALRAANYTLKMVDIGKLLS
jgi:DNA-binding CsgD family transcriptional regulator